MPSTSPMLPPGFRFHPTDEELILHYLHKRTASSLPVEIIADINIYKFNPWDLPAKAMFGEREWYFFSPRDRKYPNGVRPNRVAASGYWKATGTDKPIRMGSSRNENIGVKKVLVFYKGKPPKDVKTNWIMHEYRLAEALQNSHDKPVKLREGSMRLDDWVLCRIFQKSSRHNSPVNHNHEDSAGEDAEPKKSTSESKIHKSFSLSELLMEETDFSLLSRLESPLNMPLTNHAPLYNLNYITNNNGSYLNSQVIQSEASVLIADNNYAQFNNQFDISQPFFTQQFLLNSDHLGMH